jgi:hypothetical protein
MTKELMLKRGYHITVTSWENDADNYNTKTLVVQEREAVDMLVALFNMLGSRNRNSCHFGNMYEPSESQLQKFAEAVAAIPGMTADLEKNFAWVKDAEEDPECGAGYMDAVMDILYDVGLSGSENFYTRVCESITVFYVEQDIYAERIL